MGARTDGGEAGLHPSNIHDNAYAIGAIDFTGDMPVIFGPDGPSLGGFVCPATIVQAELWKIGQLKPGDTVRFKRLTAAQAAQAELRAGRGDCGAHSPGTGLASGLPSTPAPITVSSVSARQSGTLPRVVYRRAGDKYLLVEYGPIVLDFELRFRAHVLMDSAAAARAVRHHRSDARHSLAANPL